MQRTENSESDRAAAVTPRIRHTVPWRVVAAKALPGQRVQVKFVDGTTGEVELQGFLSAPIVDGSPFEPLRDQAVFHQVTVVLGAVQWPNGAELAPDAMYDAIGQDGRWVVT